MSAPTVLSFLGEMDAVTDAVEGSTMIAVDPAGPVDDSVHGDVLLTLMTGAPNLQAVLDRGVRWVHAIGTGVESFPLDVLDGRAFTCSRGVNAVNVAEWAFAQIITCEKQLPAMWRTTPPERWGQVDLGAVAGSTLAIVGFGSIGTALASRAVAFDMNVRAMRRRPAPSEIAGVEIVTDVTSLVAGADHVVLAAPSTAATRGMVDASFLAAMHPGAHLVNVARADLIDEAALRAALDSGQLRAASIDVSDPEPLPADHWFYAHPSVRFSPHVSWSGPGLWQATVGRFTDNLRRWRDGEPLQGVVDVEEGY